MTQNYSMIRLFIKIFVFKIYKDESSLYLKKIYNLNKLYRCILPILNYKFEIITYIMPKKLMLSSAEQTE